MTTATKSEETRQKLIEAAGQTFAEIGYEAATVRGITERAEVNIASVNYHFRDKLQLYSEVFKEVVQKRRPLLEALCASGSPEQRLYAFIKWMMLVDKTENRPWSHVLIAREMNEASGSKALDLIVELLRPIHELLTSILDDLTGHELSRENLAVVSYFVAWSCTEWLHKTEFIQKLTPEITFKKNQIEHIVDLLYGFVLGGLKRVVQNVRSPKSHDR